MKKSQGIEESRKELIRGQKKEKEKAYPQAFTFERRRTVKCSSEPKKQGGGKSGLVGRQGGEIEGDEEEGGRPLRLAGRR